MIKETVTYTDFDNNEVTEELYFHISTSELIDWYAQEGEDFPEQLKKLAESGNAPVIINTFKEIMAKGYGARVEGNSTRFFKDDRQTKEFISSPAFDQLLFDLMSDPKRAEKFFNGMFPADLVEQAADQIKMATLQPMKEAKGPISMSKEEAQRRTGLENPYTRTGEFLPWAFREPQQKELSEMTKAQLAEAMQRNMSGWEPPESL
jgi:hypothetical protein